MLSIFTSPSAMKSTNALNRANKVLQSAMERLGTGKRINSAADDAADLQIATRLQGQSGGMAVAQQNIGKASSMLQTAEGAFNEVTNILYRMKDLATQGADDTNSSDDRKSLQSEFNALNKELANIFSNTSYGEEKLFGATFNAAVNKPDSAVINKSAAAEINLRPAAAPKVNPAAAHTGSFTPEYMSYSAYGGGHVTMTGHAADGSPVRKIFYMDDPDFTRAFTYFADNNMALLNGDRIPPFILEDVTEKPAVTEPVATPEVESEPEVEPAAAPASVIKSAVGGKLASVLHFQIGAGKDEVMELDLSGQLRNVSGALGDLQSAGHDLSDGASANDMIGRVSHALDSVGAIRSSLGAGINRLGHTMNNLANMKDNTDNSIGVIRDTDYAVESSQMMRQQMLAQSSQMMLKQAGSMSNMILGFLNN